MEYAIITQDVEIMITPPKILMGELGLNEPTLNHSNGRPESGQMEALKSIPSINPLEELLPMGAIIGEAAEKETSATIGKWEPKSLNPRHREIMRRVLEGSTYVEIAEAMGITTQSIMLVATSPIFRSELAKLEQTLKFDVVQRADALSNEALDTLKVIMRKSASESRKMRAADSILDRAGYGKIEKRLVGVVDGESVIRELNRIRREKYEKNIQISESSESEKATEASTD